jgi:hypothetical protein
VVVYVSVQGSMSQALDDKLRADFQWPKNMMSEDMARELLRGDPDFFEKTGGEGSPWLQVWGENGTKLLGGTYEARRNPIRESVAMATNPAEFGKVHKLANMVPPYRLLTGTTKVGKISLVVQVAESEAPMRAYLRELLVVLLLGLPLAIAVAGFGGYLLARRALAPVDRMAEQARSITG